MVNSSGGDEDGVVDPEDLDITSDERVLELQDGKYVVATGGDEADTTGLGFDAGRDSGAGGAAADPREALRSHVDGMDTAYGFTVAGRFGGTVRDHEVYADDVETVFREFVTWYARNVDSQTPPAEVLGILSQAGGVRVRYPLRTVAELLNRHDLGPDDTIADLIDAVKADGLVLPPR